MLSPLLQTTLDTIRQATSGMTEAQLAVAPDGKWSAGQILEHLSLTYSSSAKVMERALKEGKPLGGSPTLKQRISSALVVGVGYFPSGRTAPEFTRPRGLPPAEALPTIENNLALVDAKISECEQRFGAHAIVANHPVLGPLTCEGWRKFHSVHARHHMKQIVRLRSMQK